jgi:CBS domain-containing protein
MTIDPTATAPVARITAAQEVVALDGATPVRVAALLMAERRIGSVAVRERGRLVGLVTDRDLAVTVLAHGGSGDQPMREAMRPSIPRVDASATEADCAALMRAHATHHLLVEDRGEVVGVVSLSDLTQLMLSEQRFMIDQLSTYINGR